MNYLLHTLLLLHKLFVYVIGDDTEYRTAKTERLVESICQDICRAATGGKWKLPKHIVLGMTLRHMWRGAELLTMLNRYLLIHYATYYR